MDIAGMSLIEDEQLRLDILTQLSQKPELFEPGEPLFWDDPHISQQMLAVHLDPDTAAASRPPEIIDLTIDWMISHLDLHPGDTVLDLGCGPGLYASRLSQRGLDVTGIDYSQNSITYATNHAQEHGLPATYIYQDFTTIAYDAQFDLVMQIYGELNTFSPSSRDSLLRKIHRALKPGGHFVFDVSTRVHRDKYGLKNRWHVAQSGFWKPGPHLILERGFDYPKDKTYLDQYTVVEPDGKITVYRNWFLDYSLETITPVLERQGFTVESTWSDLAGTPYHLNAEWLGIVTVKA